MLKMLRGLTVQTAIRSRRLIAAVAVFAVTFSILTLAMGTEVPHANAAAAKPYIVTDNVTGDTLGADDTLQNAINLCSTNGDCTVIAQSDDTAIVASATSVNLPTGTTITLTSDSGGPYTLTSNAARHFTIKAGVNLILKDIILDGNGAQGGVEVDGTTSSRGTLTMQHGAIIKNCRWPGTSVVEFGAAVRVKGGAFTMETGAQITNNIGSTGTMGAEAGAIGIDNNGTFQMNGGIIDNNSASNANSYAYGGGVGLRTSASFIMDGGLITGNSANSSAVLDHPAYGGGVHVGVGCSFTMNGGEISNNITATPNQNVYNYFGGGVSLMGSAQLLMTGGTISNNIAANTYGYGYGGGVWAFNQTTIVMSGGNITGNTAAGGVGSGGGISSNGSIHLSGTAAITGNTSSLYKGDGGGIFLNGADYSLAIEPGNVQISENQAPNGGGGAVGVAAYINNVDPLPVDSYNQIQIDPSVVFASNTSQTRYVPPINANDIVDFDGSLLNNDDIHYTNTNYRIHYRLDDLTYYGAQSSSTATLKLTQPTMPAAPPGLPTLTWVDSDGTTYTMGDNATVTSQDRVLVLYAKWTPVTPEITAPTQNQVMNDARPTFSGSGSSGGFVSVRDSNGQEICQAAVVANAWTCQPSIPLPSGLQTVSAVSVVDGTDYESVSMTFTIDAPAPAMTSPIDGATISGLPTIAGTGSTAGNTITAVATGGNAPQTCTTTVAGDLTWSCDGQLDRLGSGDYTLTTFETGAGDYTSAASKVNFTVVWLPAPVIETPEQGATTHGEPTVTGTGTEVGNTIQVVNQNDDPLCETEVEEPVDDGSPTWQCPLNLTEGSHTLRALERDLVGNQSDPSDPVVIQVQTTPPDPPVITSPESGSFISSSSPTILGNGSDVKNFITVWSGGKKICDAAMQADLTWSCEPRDLLDDGVYNISAKETDTVGNESEASIPVTFTIDTHAPDAPVIIAPITDTVTNTSVPEIEGTGNEIGNLIIVTANGTTICMAPVSLGGKWSCRPSALGPGSYQLVAVEVDWAGNESTASNRVDLTVDLKLSWHPIIDSPLTGMVTNNHQLTISGRGNQPGNSIMVIGTGVQICTATVEADLTWDCTSEPIDDGVYLMVADEQDNVGDFSAPSNSVTVTIDTKAPAAPKITSPTDGTQTKDQPLYIAGSGSEVGNTITVLAGRETLCTGVVGADKSWSCTSKALAVGDYELTATETDLATNTSGPSKTVTVTIAAPALAALVITSPETGAVTNNTTPTIAGTVPDTIEGTIHLWVGEKDELGACEMFDDFTWTCTPDTPLDEGKHVFSVTRTDNAGNQSEFSNLVEVTIDTTAPLAPQINSPTDGTLTKDQTLYIAGSGDEVGNTITVLAGEETLCTGTVQTDKSWSCTTSVQLEDGVYKLVAVETDLAGNVSDPSETVTVTIDTTAPEAPVITSPADPTLTNNPQVTITGTGAEAGNMLAVSSGADPICTTTVATDLSWTCDPGKLDDGTYQLTAVEKDQVGNTSTKSNTVSVTIDTTAPEAPVINSPNEDILTNNKAITITGTGDEEGNTITVTAGDTTICTTTVSSDKSWSCTSSNLDDGVYNLTATETDQAQNASESSNAVTVTIDATPPTTPVITSPADGKPINNDTPEISGTGDKPGSTITVTDGDDTVCTATVQPDKTWTCTPKDPLNDDTHDLTATETDLAGNESPGSDPVTVTIDTTAPTAPVITNPKDGTSTNQAQLSIWGTSTEPGTIITVTASGTLICTATVDPDGNWTCTAGESLTDGIYTLSATAKDTAGNISDPSNKVTVTIDTKAPAAPVITSPITDTATNDQKPEITGTGTEPGNTITVTDGDNTLCTSTVKDDLTWTCAPTDNLDDGANQLTATETDGAGNTSDSSQVITVTIDTSAPDAPSISLPVDGTSTNHSRPTVSGVGNEADNTVRVLADGQLACTATITAGLTWACTPGTDLADGQHQLSAVEVDLAGNVSLPSGLVGVTIDTTPPNKPVITAPVGGTLTNRPIDTIAGTGDEVGNTIIVTANGVEVCRPVVAIDQTWTCSVNLTHGVYQLIATETDPSDNTSAQSDAVNVTVDTVPPAQPVIGAPVSGTLTNQPQPAISGTGDKAGSTIAVTSNGAPVCTGTVISTKTWSCTPASLADGVYQLVAVETDLAGNASAPSQVVVLTIDTTAPAAPTITSPTNGVTLQVTPAITGSGAEVGNAITVRQGGGTLCSATVNASLSWSCTPARLGDGTYSVTAVETDKAGNVSDASAAVVFIMDTIKLAPPELIPGDGTRLFGTATPGLTVTFKSADGRPIAGCTDVLVPESGEFTCVPVTPLVQGSIVTATVADEIGDVSEPATLMIGPIDIAISTEAWYILDQDTITGLYFQPGEKVSLVIYSDPYEMGDRIAGPTGRVDFTVRLPDGIEPGVHTATLTGERSGTVSLPFHVTITSTKDENARTGGMSLSTIWWLAAAMIMSGAGIAAVYRRRLA